MPDSRDLIVGVLAAQAGFVTPEQVLSAAAAGLVDGQEGTLLAWLERSGALSLERRRIVEALADEAIRARSGDARAVAASLGGAGKLLETLASGTAAMAPEPGSATGLPRGGRPEVPLERPGQYTRLHELGRGSQSVVRAARDEIVGREVALKELTPVGATGSTDATRAAQARFLREVRLIAGLDHPGIVAVLELARREDGTLFCAEKLIRGRTLQASLALCESLADRLRLLRHVVDACEAVAYAHAKRIIHRDLKPSNVMVGEYGETVVVDWGLAKRREEKDEVVPVAPTIADPLLTVAGIALGTPAFMSPEQARGDLAAIDARSDVFSLGAILYQVLTGRPPFEGANAEHIMDKVRVGRFVGVQTLSPEAPPELAAIAERALSFQPAERYEDAAALAKELSTFLAGGKVGAYRYGAWQLVKKFAATHRTLTTGLAVALGALVVSAAVVAFRLHAARVALASSLAERAYSSEAEGDWAQAAAYFAAAREQNDTSEARWGVALAAERATERILAKHGPAGSFVDVVVVPDGRALALGQTGNLIEVRDIASGTKLWSHDNERVFAAMFLPSGQLRLTVREGWAFYDAATGDRLATFDRNGVGRPCPGTYPPPVVALRGQLILRAEGAPPRILAEDVSADERCFVSTDRRRAAYVDVSENIQLIDVEDGRRLASRSASGLRSMFFSEHGLVIAKPGRIEVIGGPEGELSIDLPESGFGETQTKVGGDAVSPDGHLAVLARLGSNRADVIDLRTRSIRGTVHYAAGWPRLAFSPDGQQIFAAGLESGSTLDGWRLPSDEMPTTHPGAWRFLSVNFSTTGHRFLIVDSSRHRYELYGAGNQLIGSGAVSDELHSVLLSGDGTAVLLVDEGGSLVLREAQSGRLVWKRPCHLCQVAGMSADGSRVAEIGADGLEVWDTRADRVVFAETARLGGFDTFGAISLDGNRVAWAQGATGIVRDLTSGGERTLKIEGGARGFWFSPDSTRIVSVSLGRIALWDASTGQSIWNVPHAIPWLNDFRWSADGRALLLQYETLGTELLDAESGERRARFFAAGIVSPMVVFVQPDLQWKLVMTATSWDRRPLPQPVTESPASTLARTLARTGLELHGVDLVAAP